MIFLFFFLEFVAALSNKKLVDNIGYLKNTFKEFD